MHTICCSAATQWWKFSISGKSAHVENSTKRAGHLIRPTTPKSPVASASAFESVEGSDDDDITDNANLETSYLDANGDVVSSLCTCVHLYIQLLHAIPLSLCTYKKLKISSLFLSPISVSLFLSVDLCGVCEFYIWKDLYYFVLYVIK